MTPRTSMAALISLTRDLIGDPAGTSQALSDDQIERSLDNHRWEFRYLRLEPLTTMVNGSAEYRDWQSAEQYWEADATLHDTTYAALTPSATDPLHGRWSFDAHQTDVLVKGKAYDPFGAAADLLELMAAGYGTEFDFSADGESYQRSQKSQSLLALAEQYRKQQRIIMAEQKRDDLSLRH